MYLFTFKWQSGSETPQYEQCIILHWHVTVTCSSRSFLTMASSQFSFVQETTSKIQQSKCFCQEWTTMLNVWLQIARTCNHIRGSDFGKHAPRVGAGGGYSREFLVGLCHPVVQILTLFQTKNCNFPHLFSDQSSKIHTHFQTWPLGRNYVIIT